LNTSVIILVAMATLDRYRFYIKGDIPEDWWTWRGFYYNRVFTALKGINATFGFLICCLVTFLLEFLSKMLQKQPVFQETFRTTETSHNRPVNTSV
jgi:hypothetical protein